MKQTKKKQKSILLTVFLALICLSVISCGKNSLKSEQTEQTQEITVLQTQETEKAAETDTDETTESDGTKEAVELTEAETEKSGEDQTETTQTESESQKSASKEQTQTTQTASETQTKTHTQTQSQTTQTSETAAAAVSGSTAQETTAAATTANTVIVGRTLEEYNSVLRTKISEADLEKVDAIIVQIVTSGMSTQEKIKAVHDWMVKNIYYDTSLKSYDVHTALFSGKAICQGYAETFYVFMGELGISCQNITGTANNGTQTESHMWNAVMLDSAWYYIDVTWDDPMMSDTGSSNYPDGSNMSYDYFLIPYTEMAKNHTATSAVPSPNGTSTAYHDWAVSLRNTEKAEALVSSCTAAGYTTFLINDTQELKTACAKITAYGSYAFVYNGNDLSADTISEQLKTWLGSHTSDYFNKGYHLSIQYRTDGTTDIWYFYAVIQANG